VSALIAPIFPRNPILLSLGPFWTLIILQKYYYYSVCYCFSTFSGKHFVFNKGEFTYLNFTYSQIITCIKKLYSIIDQSALGEVCPTNRLFRHNFTTSRNLRCNFLNSLLNMSRNFTVRVLPQEVLSLDFTSPDFAETSKGGVKCNYRSK